MTSKSKLDRRRIVELAGAFLVLLGLINLAIFVHVHGYLPAPFVFDTNDTFMDWFHTAYWAHNPGAYSVWKSIYFPLSFVITGIFADPTCYATSAFDARDCDFIGIATLLLTYVGCVLASAVALYRIDRSTAFFRTAAIATGGPLLFALERGNLILMAYLVFVLLYGGLLKTKWKIAAAVAFLANLKVYLILTLAAFAVKRNWRTLELCGFAALALYLLSLLVVGSGTPIELARNIQIWMNSFAISVWDQIPYSTTYQPYLLLDQLHYPVRDYIDQQSVDLVKSVIEYQVLASRLMALICLAGAWFYPSTVSLHRLVFFILVQSFIAQNPGGYAFAFVIFLIFMERWTNAAIGTAIIAAYLVSIPTDFAVASIFSVERPSWITGRSASVDYVLTIGALLRPGLLAIALWALAIDTLVRLHRSVKAGPPTLGLSLPRHARTHVEPRPSPAQAAT